MTAMDLTGGYMIEVDAYAHEEPKSFTSNHYGMPVTIKYPDSDEITVAQERYIANHFNNLTNAVYGRDYSNPTTGFRKYLDVETFLRHFLVGEFCGNTDTYWSVRMTKKKDEDKFSVGPVWDFDLGFENDWRTYPINSKTDWICFSNGSSAAGDTKGFVRRIFSDSGIQQRLKEIYSQYRDKDIITEEELLKVVSDNAEKLAVSQDLNFKRWRIMNEKVHENPVIYGSYEGEVQNVKNYIANRIKWVDKKLNYVRTNVGDNPYLAENSVLSGISIYTYDGTIYLEGATENVTLRVVNVNGQVLADGVNMIDNYSIKVNNGVFLILVTDSNGQSRKFKCVVY